jgi:hypothetical protein
LLRFFLAAFFILHGLVHLLWFVVPWQITTVDGLPYSTKVLMHRIDLGRAGIRVVGLLWLAATVLWVAAGLASIFGAVWWQALAAAAALYSAALCVLGLPDAKYGLAIDLAILLVLLLNRSFGWLA